MNKVEKIPAGYKVTKIDVIPEDWEVHEIEDVADVLSGKRIPKGRTLTENITPYPYITVSDMGAGSVNLENIRFVPEDVYPLIKKYRIFVDDIYISVAGTLGLIGTIPKQLNGANLTENADRLANIKCDKNYLLYILSSPLIQKRIDEVKTLGAQPKLALTRIRKFCVAIPKTKSEQTAIATVLSDTDALIEHLEKLIAKKKAIKQGAMQQLLTGKKRLSGFSGEWKEEKLKNIADFLKGRGLSKSKLLYDGNFSCILYGELFTTYSRIIKEIKSKTNSREGLPSINGDILMPGSTTTVGIDLATASALQQNNVLLGGDLIVIRKKEPNNYNSNFLANYLTHISKYKIAEITQGITIIHLHGSRLQEIFVKIPSDIYEQTAIATILSDMDTEIESLEKKRDKYIMLKQSMMQQLLTGKIRLGKNLL